MTTSGTYAFNPALSDLMLNAFARCGIRRAGLTPEHLADAAMCANMLQSDWSNDQVDQWTVELSSISLVEGTATYTLDTGTIMILSAYIETGSPAQGRLITSVSVDDYAAMPDKVTTGLPTLYWFNKQITPVITIWQPPDGNGPYTLKYYRARQMQDATQPNGVTPDIPFNFINAYAAAWAVNIAEIYAPKELPRLEARAERAFKKASQRDVPNAPMMIVPQFGRYDY